MNFADLRNTQDTKMQLFGLVSSIEGVTYTASKGTPKQSVQIMDDGGEQNYVTIYPGNSPAMDGSFVGQRTEFSLSARKGTGQYSNNIYYGGFYQIQQGVQQGVQPQQQQAPQPQGGTSVAGQVHYPPQQPQQAPQQAAVAPNVNNKPNDSFYKPNAMNNATSLVVAMLATGTKIDPIETIIAAYEKMYAALDGSAPPRVAEDDSEPPASDDDVPF